jgi:two-component system, response regulator RegA
MLLVIEDSLSLATAIGEALPHYSSVRVAPDLATARGILESCVPECIVMDVCLPDGSSLELLPTLRTMRPWPRVIAVSGAAAPEQAFHLAQAGVRAFVQKPLDLAQLREVWARVMREPPDLEPLVRATVGHRSLSELEDFVRRSMSEEALARSKGSVSGAARLLEVSRQLYQHIRRTGR